MTRFLTLLIFFCLSGFMSQAHAQAYCIQFNETPIGASKIEVELVLHSTANFRLGNSKLVFSYNPAAIIPASPLVVTNLLANPNYSLTTSTSVSGVVTITIDYVGTTSTGTTVTPSGLRIGKIVFDALNPVIDKSLKVVKKGVKGVLISKSDNSTLVIPSAQCPASPYTSLFYDIDIELGVTIPAEECVENSTAGNTNLNLAEDATVEILPPGFNFKFYCETVFSLRVGEDGAILVNAPGANLPNTNAVKLRSQPRIIAPWMDEWRVGMGTINTLVKNLTLNGVTNRALIVQWNNVSPVSTNPALNTDPLKATFNVVFFENSSVIKFNYKDVDFKSDIVAPTPAMDAFMGSKQYAIDGSVGISGPCPKGERGDGVNNILYDGPEGISLFDFNSTSVYKAITFYAVTDACEVTAPETSKTVCQNSTPFTMPINSSAINGRWSGNGVPYLDNPNIIGAKFTPSTPGTFLLEWVPECLNLGYVVNVTVNPLPTVNAGLDQPICNGSVVTLNGTIGNGAINARWSAPSGIFNNINALNARYTPSIATGSVTLTLTVDASTVACPSVSDNMVVTIAAPVTPTFAPITICQGQTPIPTLPTTSTNGITGTWSPSVISNLLTGTYTFTPNASFPCAIPTTLTVTVTPPPSVSAGANQLTCALSSAATYTMNGSLPPAGGTGLWTIVGPAYGAVITSPTNRGTTITGLAVGKTVKLRWTVTPAGGCPPVSSDVEIGADNTPPVMGTFNKNTALAGSTIPGTTADAFVCANIVIDQLSDNCTSRAELMGRLSMVRDVDNPARTYLPTFPTCLRFTCADVNKNILTQVWVVDNAGNATYIHTSIFVQDNMRFCNPTPTPQALISVTTETNTPIRNAKVTISPIGSLDGMDYSHTNGQGIGELRNLTQNARYTLQVNKEDEPYFGVTTYDIAVISQHILGIKSMNSPYCLLAADVNEDNEIDAKDIVTIRNFILRRTPSLPTRSWRFVDAGYNFINPTRPFGEDFPTIINFTQNALDVKKAFRAVKKGDVTPQLTTNNLDVAQTRSKPILTLQTDDILLEQGKEYAIKFTANDFRAVAYQFTLKNTEGGLVIKGMAKGDLPNVSDSQFAIFDNAITTSWNGKSDKLNPHLFTLIVQARQSGRLSDIMQLGSFITPAEANDADGNSLDIILNFKNAQSLMPKAFALYQNYPNPFDKNTIIGFDLPKESKAHVTIFTLEGKIIYDKEASFAAGYNEITVDGSNLSKTGVLYYRLTTGEHSAIRKMVVAK